MSHPAGPCPAGRVPVQLDVVPCIAGPYEPANGTETRPVRNRLHGQALGRSRRSAAQHARQSFTFGQSGGIFVARSKQVCTYT